MRVVLGAFAVLFGLEGILYIAHGDVLWGLMVLVLSAVCAFGLEGGMGRDWHPAAHVLAGGIFATAAAGFEILDKLVSYLSEPKGFSGIDVVFIITSAFALMASLSASKEFE